MKNYDEIDELVIKAKSILGDTAAEIIASELKLEKWDGKKSCSPFKKEDTPSFIWNPNGSYFKDFSSGRTYDIINHFMANENLSFLGALKKLCEMVNIEVDESLFKSTSSYKKIRLAHDEPENDRKIVEDYLAKRGISKKTLDFCNVKQSEDGMIAFQMFDEFNNLVSTKYRVSHAASNKEAKWKWQQDIDVHDILYGINRIDRSKTIAICEGFNDRLAIVEAGFTNVVSIPGGAEADKWVDYNYDFLTDCKDIVLWFDNDQAGLDGRKKIANRLGEYRVRLVNPDDEIVKAVQNYYIPYGLDIDKTDANNVLLACGTNTILNLIENAEIIENPRLKDLFSYTPVDIQTLPRVSTGFKALDKVVSGNFDNNLVILSGWSASGKSTMVAEMGIIAPLEAGKKIMVFSGEANGGVLLGTTYRPLAGRNHVIEWDNSAQGLPNGYSVTKEAMEFIKEYYKGKVYNYDDGDEILTTADEVLAQMEYAYKRYGVTHFTLDNLMCISCVSTEDDEKYESQYKFTLALKRFTRKYNVTVFLVAHAKKPVPGQKVVDMYSVSGASEIINLADRGFSISRLYDDPEGYNSCVYIMKDRVEGKAGTKVKLRYDRPTNRIYSDNDELFKPRQWEKDFKVNYPESIKSKIVGHRDLAMEAVANLF